MMTAAEHNEAHWYVVRWLDAHSPHPAGWYVLRVCPCHRNHAVTEHPYPDEASAMRGLEVILSVTPI